VVRKQGLHLCFGFHVRFLSQETKPLRVVEIASRADRQQHVVRLRVFPPEVVGVIGGHNADAELSSKVQHTFGHLAFIRYAVLLDFEPEALRAERLTEPFGAAASFVQVSLSEIQRNLTGQAGSEAHEATRVMGQHLLVNPGPPVEPLHEADRRQPDQVAVSFAVPGQQHQVAVGRRRPVWLLPKRAGTEGEIRLEAENGSDLLPFGVLVERPGSMHVAMVGNGQAVHAKFPDLGHEIRDPVGPVQQGVLAVGVEMDKWHLSLCAIGYALWAAPLTATARSP
jgi:hypothetical protein